MLACRPWFTDEPKSKPSEGLSLKGCTRVAGGKSRRKAGTPPPDIASRTNEPTLKGSNTRIAA